jgi:hypothetical protein
VLALAGAALGGVVPARGEGDAGDCIAGEPGGETTPPPTGAVEAQPVAWGRYERPVDQRRLLHNLSHGGVGVQYGPEVPAVTVAEIRAWYLADPDGMVLAPLGSLGDRIALTAWGRLERSAGFDEPAFSSFRDELRFHAPGPVSREAMRPGVGGRPVALLGGLAVAPEPFARELAISLSLGHDAVLDVVVEDDRGRPVRILGLCGGPGTGATSGAGSSRRAPTSSASRRRGRARRPSPSPGEPTRTGGLPAG